MTNEQKVYDTVAKGTEKVKAGELDRAQLTMAWIASHLKNTPNGSVGASCGRLVTSGHLKRIVKEGMKPFYALGKSYKVEKIAKGSGRRRDLSHPLPALNKKRRAAFRKHLLELHPNEKMATAFDLLFGDPSNPTPEDKVAKALDRSVVTVGQYRRTIAQAMLAWAKENP
jgi:hypothetical protein